MTFFVLFFSLDIVDHRGREFVLSFVSQHIRFPYDGNNVLYISSFEDTQTRVHVPALAQQSDQQYELRAGGVKIISLPGSTRTGSSTGIEKKKGIRITGDEPISVQGLSILSNAGEGFLGLPVETLGTHYIVSTFAVVINAVLQVVAKEDNTEVSINLRLPQNGRVRYGEVTYYNGQDINVTLNDLDVFQVLADSDLTGTTVTSSKPIAVFSGNDCAMVPKLLQQPCNHLVEQLPPVNHWGTQFITNPTPNRQGGDIFHVIASAQNTLVYVDSQSQTRLNKGETFEIIASWNESKVISTSRPSLVVQYSSGTGSPSMSLVPPNEWFSNDYTVYVPKDEKGNAFDSYINVVIDTRFRGGLHVKGANDLINWEIISGGFSRASLPLPRDGVYHVYHKDALANFSAVLFGMTPKKLFAFPVGMKRLQPWDASCSPTNTTGGDKIDNDCDGATDEELANGVDDDGDGRIDEDLVTQAPVLNVPRDFVTPPLLSCDRSSNVANVENTGLAKGSAQGVCKIRGGKITISNKDNIVDSQSCERELDRVWTVKDPCGNVIEGHQRIKISTPEDPKITFPDDVTFTCREKKYLGPKFTGEVKVTASSCPRNVTVTHRDTYSGCSDREGRLDRSWTVQDKCKQSSKRIQVIRLLPKESRRTTNYVVLFKITSEAFSVELKDKKSSSFKSLADGLELELGKTFTQSKSKFGRFFVAATTLGFSNGSVIPSMLIKIDAEAQFDQRQLVDFMNTTVKSGTLGKYQVDPSSVQSTDFDECQAPHLNECHEKAKCTNTLGSYNCTCIDGYYGDGFLCQAPPSIYYVDPPTEAGTEENVTLTCHANGLPEPTFTWITPDGYAVNATESVYEIEILDDDSQNKRGKTLQKDGSLLIFNTRVHDQGIYKCVAINVMGQDEGSVNLTVREDLVEVEAAITIEEEVFDKDLENKSSVRYQAIEKQVEQELTALFKDIEGFERVIILGFYNGSVKVRFRVVVKVDQITNKKPVVIANKVGKTLRVSVKNGQIGSLKVKPTVELRERPPPPVDVQSADVKQTEAVIMWSHPELYDMYAISSYSLQIRKFGTTKWTQFTTTRGENHRLTNLDPDTAYFVRLKSENKYGKGEPSESGELKTEKEGSGAELALAIVLPLLLLIILAIVAVFVYRRWKKKGKRSGYQTTDEEVPMNRVTAEPRNQAGEGFMTFGRERYAPIPGETANGASAMQIQASFAWREIPRERITLGKVLGEGEFGMVVKGELTEDDGHITHCAVKTLKRTATESDFKDLLNELERLKDVGNHPNLVNLIGACSTGGPLMIVVEFAEHGNLLRYLRDHRKQNYDDMNEYSLDISSAERLRIACDVSNGMKHLAIMKCAHRDLAARNVLLGEGMVAKVADFGLSRDIYTDNQYEKKTEGKLPAKWMAVESLDRGMYTSQSDVWSFGVLLWEIETGGCAPYAGMVMIELLDKLKAGHRLDKPRYCTDWLYAVMLRCWNANPKLRPTFEELSDELHRMLRQETDYLTPEDFKEEPSYINTSKENISSA
ncbi:hypothetical protein ACROYT_G043342 [Oculina patagonica]